MRTIKIKGLEGVLPEGFPTGVSVLISGETGTGKTLLSLLIASAFISNGYKVIFVTTKDEERVISSFPISLGTKISLYTYLRERDGKIYVDRDKAIEDLDGLLPNMVIADIDALRFISKLLSTKKKRIPHYNINTVITAIIKARLLLATEIDHGTRKVLEFPQYILYIVEFPEVYMPTPNEMQRLILFTRSRKRPACSTLLVNVTTRADPDFADLFQGFIQLFIEVNDEYERKIVIRKLPVRHTSKIINFELQKFLGPTPQYHQ